MSSGFRLSQKETPKLACISSLWHSDGVSLCLQRRDLGDRNIPFAGGVGSKGVTQINWPAVETTLDAFRRADACEAATTQKNGVVTRRDWVCADGRAMSLITIAGAGHQWPGAAARHPLIERLLRLDPPSERNRGTLAFF